jgi:hypothetical protein
LETDSVRALTAVVCLIHFRKQYFSHCCCFARVRSCVWGGVTSNKNMTVGGNLGGEVGIFCNAPPRTPRSRRCRGL